MWNVVTFIVCMIFFGFNLYPALNCLFSGEIVPGVIGIGCTVLSILLLFGKIHPNITGSDTQLK